MTSHAIKRCKICGKPFIGEAQIGPTCQEHEGLLEKYYVKKSGVPNKDVYISLVDLCYLAEELGKSRYWMVKLTGGDGGVEKPFAPELTVYLFGQRKYCRRDAISTVMELAKIK